MKVLSPVLIAAAIAIGASTAPQTAAAQEASPRHVILFIGDGMDEQQITIARNYLKGAKGKLLLDTMPVRSVAQILTIEDKAGGLPMYVADSANTATSIATGAITSRGRIATSAGDDKPLTTIVELAEQAGYKTGLVSTASITDATPAAFIAHINFRLCENPELVEAVVFETTFDDINVGGCPQYARKNGGPGAISEQLATSPVDVLLGGGSKHFAAQAEAGDGSVLEMARRHGYRTVENLDQLQRSEPGAPLLGLFAPGTMPVRLQGESGRLAEQPKSSFLNRLHRYLGSVTLPETMTCEPNPDHGNTPSLKQMTDTALAHLSAGNDRGFFLMVESASIDKQAHERKPCGSIGELEQLEEALASALAFAEQNPDTLVLVTADHSQAAQLIPFVSLFEKFPLPTYSPGYIARIETPEGGTMVVNYATTNFSRAEHTGAAVPLYANAAGVNRVPPFVQQPELFRIMVEYLGL